MQHAILITEEILDSRADYAESRGLIPELLLKLIAASLRIRQNLGYHSEGV